MMPEHLIVRSCCTYRITSSEPCAEPSQVLLGPHVLPVRYAIAKNPPELRPICARDHGAPITFVSSLRFFGKPSHGENNIYQKLLLLGAQLRTCVQFPSGMEEIQHPHVSLANSILNAVWYLELHR